MHINYTAVPKGRLKAATGMPDVTFNLSPRKREDLLMNGVFSLLSVFQRTAIAHPGKTFKRYHEENGYEYEDRVTYDEASNTLITNDIRCPLSSWHHIGQTCGMCGQKD